MCVIFSIVFRVIETMFRLIKLFFSLLHWRELHDLQFVKLNFRIVYNKVSWRHLFSNTLLSRNKRKLMRNYLYQRNFNFFFLTSFCSKQKFRTLNNSSNFLLHKSECLPTFICLHVNQMQKKKREKKKMKIYFLFV